MHAADFEYKKAPLVQQIAYQCGPVLQGVKMANILIVPKEEKEKIIDLFKKLPIGSFLLAEDQVHAIFLILRTRLVAQHLKEEKQTQFMHQMGYTSMHLESVLKELNKRYRAYQQNKKVFPHEIGILLGYPTEDVISFIENGGSNYLALGYWKVYHNVEQAFELFELYDKAKRQALFIAKKGRLF